MNRADQAPEPSIEELLASIRLIISDADKQSPAEGEPREPGEVSAGEVFDLTDELVFPGEPARPKLVSSQSAANGPPWPDGHPGQQTHLAPRERPALPAPDITPAQAPARAAAQEELPAPQVHRPESRNPAPVSTPIWSRRELPAAAAQPPAAARPRQDPEFARRAAAKWAGDIQMPVSEEGPVGLYPSPFGRGQPEKPGADAEDAASKRAGAEARQAAEEPGSASGPAAMAALAQRLARSAVGVLEATELENAKEVDFEQLDATSKAEVAEKFADAIESVAQAVQEEARSQEVEDGHLFQPAPQEQPAPESIVAAAAAMEAHWYAESESPVRAEARVNPETVAEDRAKPELKEGSRGLIDDPEPVSTKPAWLDSPATVAPHMPSAPPAPLETQPLAQAQFMGAAQVPVPFQGGGALESVVREMLRPLLVQWLNENMPRILENAIREEIATRGLFPKSDG